MSTPGVKTALTVDPALTQHFKEPPLFVYKRGPNLQDKLVRANILAPITPVAIVPSVTILLKRKHKSSIRRKDENYPVACHFNNQSHPISSSYLRFREAVGVRQDRGVCQMQTVCDPCRAEK